jgi:hypothetical protein
MKTFVRRYGWRAYALPVLVVLTIVMLMTTKTQPRARILSDATPHRSPSGSSVAVVPPVARATHAATTAPATPASTAPASSSAPHAAAPTDEAALPAGAPFTMQGAGTFSVVKGTTPRVGGTGASVRLFRYDIEVEKGITGIDVPAFARMVDRVLADPRSWAGHRWDGRKVALQRVDSGPIDFRVSLTSALTVRQYCGYTQKIETSCYAPAGNAPGLRFNRVVLNVSRWVRGAAAYRGDLEDYRIYMINHEDGHALGHDHAQQCLPNGMAPVMMQQTISLRSQITGEDCRANPWPYPPGVRGAPGVE